MAAIAPPPIKARKKLLKRAAKDHSQTLRRAFQLAFLALNVGPRTPFVRQASKAGCRSPL